MSKDTRYVGLDVHKDTISVAVAEPGRAGEVLYVGRIANSEPAIRKLVKKLGPVEMLRCCYEAGPCGYVLYWLLTKLGVDCTVVAPSLIPERAGDRVKTDRRDAEKLARLHRSGELVAVWVPDEAHEALRDLVRLRESAVKNRGRMRDQLTKFLLRRGRSKPTEWTSWTRKHMEWLGQQKFVHVSDEVIHLDLLSEVHHADGRIERLEQKLNEAMERAPAEQQELVAALATLRGVAQLTAVTLMVEVGCFSRFEKASALMSYCGLVPSEHSTGDPKNARRGRITKAGNAHLRRILGEASWHYAKRPCPSPTLARRRKGASPVLLEIARKAEHRLSSRFTRLTFKNVPRPKAAIAVARELLGFVWDIGVQVERQQRERRPGAGPREQHRHLSSTRI
jgi:transposase